MELSHMRAPRRLRLDLLMRWILGVKALKFCTAINDNDSSFCWYLIQGQWS